MHVNVAGRDLRQAGRTRERRAMRELGAIAGASEELDGDPCPARKDGGDPLCDAECGERCNVERGSKRPAGDAARLPRRIGRHPQREEVVGERCDVIAAKRIAAFHRIAPPARDELRQIAVARSIGGEQHELHAVDERDLGADDEGQPCVLRCDVGADSAPNEHSSVTASAV
jgi:hypothetical protein